MNSLARKSVAKKVVKISVAKLACEISPDFVARMRRQSAQALIHEELKQSSRELTTAVTDALPSFHNDDENNSFLYIHAPTAQHTFLFFHFDLNV